MNSRCFACSLTPVLAIAGLLGLGAAGYRVAGGGCPFSHCDGAAGTNLVSTSQVEPLSTCGAGGVAHDGHTKLVSDASKPACCAGMSEAECKERMGACPGHGGGCDQKGEATCTGGPEKVAASGK